VLVYTLVVVASGVAAIVLYVVATALLYPPRHEHDPDIFRRNNWFHEADAELGSRPSPYRHVVQRGGATTTIIFTDDRGAPVDGPGAPPQERVDVLAVGGSQSWGYGLANPDTFTSVLARRLSVSASNLSVSSYGGVQSMLRLGRNIELRPRVVIYGLWANHLERNLRRCMAVDGPVCLEAPVIRFDDARRPYIRIPSDPARTLELLRRWFVEVSGGPEATVWTDMFWTAYGLSRYLTDFFDGADVDIQDPTLQMSAVEFVLREMHAAAASVGARLLVIYIPDYLGKRVEPMPKALVTLTDALGVVLVNMEQRFVRMRILEQRIAIPGDGHLGRRAHVVIADEIVAALQERSIVW
jgi:hypothetical protein